MELGPYIEMSNLNSSATMKDIEALCNKALENHVSSVVVFPYYVALATELLKGSQVAVSTVIGYPYGASISLVKAYEAIACMQEGATEFGIVIYNGSIQDEDFESIQDEIEELRDSVDGKTLKVIVDSRIMKESQLLQLLTICKECFVHYLEIIIDENTSKDLIVNLVKQKGELLELKISGKTRVPILDWIALGVSKIDVDRLEDYL